MHRRKIMKNFNKLMLVGLLAVPAIENTQAGFADLFKGCSGMIRSAWSRSKFAISNRAIQTRQAVVFFNSKHNPWVALKLAEKENNRLTNSKDCFFGLYSKHRAGQFAAELANKELQKQLDAKIAELDWETKCFKIAKNDLIRMRNRAENDYTDLFKK